MQSGGAVVNLDVPPGKEVTVSMPTVADKPVIGVNDSVAQGVLAEGGTRTELRLGAGRYLIRRF
jgi:hypothetical protein